MKTRIAVLLALAVNLAACGGTDGDDVTNLAPEPVNDSATTAEDSAVDIDVLANDSDADGDAIAVIAVGSADNGAASLNSDSTINYAPTADFFGEDAFTYSACDPSGSCNDAVVIVTVTAVNDAPAAAADSATTAMDTAVDVAVLANDTDIEGDSLTVTAVADPAQGSTSINPDGSVHYTPAAGYFGSDSFTYTIADDDGATASGGVAVNVDFFIARVSVATDSTAGNDHSDAVVVASAGDLLAFASQATNLVASDNNGFTDIFVHDRASATTELVSIASGGAAADANCSQPAISADGRFVAFTSAATTLASDSNGVADVFIRDRHSGTTELVSVASDESQGNQRSDSPAMSADGRFVTFRSEASNLVAGDNNGAYDIFVRDRQKGATLRVSVDSAAVEADASSAEPAISGDGRYVAFHSSATNLVTGDDNDFDDVFVHDLTDSATVRVSVNSAGAQSDGLSQHAAVSNGGVVAFFSAATNLVAGDDAWVSDVFVHDLGTAATERISLAWTGVEADAASSEPSLSADGRFVAFRSYANNLVPPPDGNATWDVFVHDRDSGTTRRVNVSAAGDAADQPSAAPAISADGRFVGFASDATNLVEDDSNLRTDAFVARNPLAE